jgi:hypothetical protein
MERFITAIVWAIVWTIVFFGLVIFFAGLAQAHDWYTGTRNPVTHIGCCGVQDCKPVSIETGEIVELENEFVVYKYGREFHFPKKEAMPSQDGQYHACMWGGPLTDGQPDPRLLKPRCLFYPLNT